MKGYGVGARGELLSADRLREMTVQRNGLMKEVLRRWMGTAGDGRGPIDAVVAPVSPWCAVRSGFANQGEHGNMYVAYTGVWNLLDLPACTFPVTKARGDDWWEHEREAVGGGGGSDKNVGYDGKRESWDSGRPKPLNDLDARIQADWDPEFYAGAPVGLQCVGQRLREEEVLGVVRALRDALMDVGEGEANS